MDKANAEAQAAPARYEVSAYIGNMPAAGWQCECGARGIAFDPRVIAGLQKGTAINDTCGKCGAQLVIKQALVMKPTMQQPNRHERRAQIVLAHK